ncbi:TniQ family protein [Streptosporangium canum]|uniref:TniQ family protein n=1 Tax=Streptosporangium canum TaxID=324952 RepID=UPI0033B889E4
MRAWRNGDLPVFVPPLPGEALDSWLEAYARRLRVTIHAFISFIGLLGSRPGMMTQRLTLRERDALQRATGLAPQALVAMTLEPYDGLTVTFDKKRPTAMRRPPHWRSFGSSPRYCPGCLSESGGRWPLAWRQPWSFACLRHHCLLLEWCPACEQPVRVSGTRVGGPSQPGLCTRGRHHHQGTRRSRVACNFPLDQAPIHDLPPHGFVLAAQRHIDILLAALIDAPRPAREELSDLYALGWRTLAALTRHLEQAPAVAHRVLAEVGGAPPAQGDTQDATDVRSIAIATSLARLALPHPDPDEPALLDWLMETSQHLSAAKESPGVSPRAYAWRNTSPHLAGRALAPLDATLTVMSRIRYGTASPRPYWRELAPDEITRRAASIPGKLWPSWTMRLLGPHLNSGSSADALRTTASAMLMLPGTRLDYQPAADLLNPEGDRHSRTGGPKIIQHCDPAPLAAALAQLAWALDEFGSPIDYSRRRRTFHPDTITWDEGAWERIRAQVIWPPEGPAPIKLVRWQLLALLHGADPEPTDHKITTYQRARAATPAPLRDFLHQQACTQLDRSGIDEPLVWEPPGSWATVPGWPGFDPDTVDEELVLRLVALGYSEKYITTQLRLPLWHFMLYAESRGLTVPPPRTTGLPRSRARLVPRVGPLAPDRLRHHYLGEGMTQHQIAELADCGDATVACALRESGIPLRTRRPIGDLRQAAPRAWLQEQYLIRGRSTPDIARELGTGKNQIMRLLRHYGIPKHPTGKYSNPFAPLDIPLSPAMRTVSRTKNCLPRLRHLVGVPGHNNLSAAATALGTKPGNLSCQITSIERAAGFTIIERTRPLTPTEAGHAFLSEARHLLELLDADPK